MSKVIIIACGGTGGHIHPALAVAEVLKDRGNTLGLIVPGNRPAEQRAAKAWQGALCYSTARPLRHVFRTLIAIFKCRHFLKREGADLLFTTGGYTSFAPVVAARWLGIPVVLHEANSCAGKAVKFLSKHFKIEEVELSFAQTEAQLPWAHTVVTGLPLRREVITDLAQAQKVQKAEGQFTIFVTGGSQGAMGMDKLVAPILASLATSDPQVRIVHQCGQGSVETLEEIYAPVKAQVELTTFITSMGTYYGRADLVIARAGAATCFEIARCAVPTIFIPLPTAAEDHQTKNAAAVVACGGAIRINQLAVTPAQLAEIIGRLYSDRTLLEGMRTAFKFVSPVKEAAQVVADQLEQILKKA